MAETSSRCSVSLGKTVEVGGGDLDESSNEDFTWIFMTTQGIAHVGTGWICQYSW